MFSYERSEPLSFCGLRDLNDPAVPTGKRCFDYNDLGLEMSSPDRYALRRTVTDGRRAIDISEHDLRV